MPIDMSSRQIIHERRPFVLKGSHVFAMMVAFFVVVAGVNALMMTMAIQTMPGLDAKNGYEVSQHYNAEISRMGVQDKQAWSADLKLARNGGSAEIRLQILDKQQLAVDGLVIKARLLHPANRRLDREATLNPVGLGRYVAVIADLAPGAWTASIEAEQEGRTVFSSLNRVFLKE